MSIIPQMYVDQAIKPRGNTVNERLNYLLTWYTNTGTKVAKDATWDYQIEFNNLMAEFGSLCEIQMNLREMQLSTFFLLLTTCELIIVLLLDFLCSPIFQSN